MIIVRTAIGATLLGVVLTLALLTGCQSPPAPVSTSGTRASVAPVTTPTPSKAPSAAQAASKAAEAAGSAAVAASKPAAPESDGWVLVGQSLKAEQFTGAWSGSVRLRNTADRLRSGIVRVTILPASGDDPVGVLTGTLNNVAAGAVGTAVLISTDKYAGGKGLRVALDVTSF